MRKLRGVAGVGVVAVALAACGTFKGEVMPLEEALTRTPVHLLGTESHPGIQPPAGLPSDPIEIDGRFWMAMPNSYALSDRMVRPVLPVQGVVFHALAWDESPFDRLLVEESPGIWREFLVANR